MRRDDGEEPSVQNGDKLIVWTHEDVDWGNGLGLTAFGYAANVEVQAEETFATITDIHLLTPHLQLNAHAAELSDSDVLSRLIGNRQRRTIELNPTEEEQFWIAVRKAKAVRQSLVDQAESRLFDRPAVEDNESDIAENFKRRFAMVETRPQQSSFRQRLMERYGERCVISGCNVSAVLQAAHIVPFSKGIAIRDAVRNGLLLRSDIHVLFDKLMLAIDPETSRVVIAPELEKTEYNTLSGLEVKTFASPVFLARQFWEFKRVHD